MAYVKHSTGKQGELLAKEFLIRKGYTIVDQNVSSRYGEIDIIAKHQEEYVFVEVKTRKATDQSIGAAEYAINPQKKEKMLKTVYTYLLDQEIEDDLWRCDAISVYMSKKKATIIHYPYAFEHN